jgi:hypothetical protein
VKGTKTQTRKKERKKGKNPGTTEGMRGVQQRKFRSNLGRESAKERKMMARFRCGNEKRENRYWIEGEERRCRTCYEEKKTIEHTWNMDVAK